MPFFITYFCILYLFTIYLQRLMRVIFLHLEHEAQNSKPNVGHSASRKIRWLGCWGGHGPEQCTATSPIVCPCPRGNLNPCTVAQSCKLCQLKMKLVFEEENWTEKPLNKQYFLFFSFFPQNFLAIRSWLADRQRFGGRREYYSTS